MQVRFPEVQGRASLEGAPHAASHPSACIFGFFGPPSESLTLVFVRKAHCPAWRRPVRTARRGPGYGFRDLGFVGFRVAGLGFRDRGL